MKFKLLLLTMICCIVTSTPVMATPDISLTAITDASINPTSEVFEWRYKIENGKNCQSTQKKQYFCPVLRKC